MAQTKSSIKVTDLWLDSECILKVEPTVFSDRLDVVRERDKNDYKVSDLRILRVQVPCTEIRETVSSAICKVGGGWVDKEFHSAHVKFKISIKYASVEVLWEVGYKSLKFQRKRSRVEK